MKLSERICLALRDEIMDLELAPEVSLNEIELGRRFGTSRTLVREALLRLQGEGLLTLYPGKGAFVAEFSLQETVELFQLREALERYIVS